MRRAWLVLVALAAAEFGGVATAQDELVAVNERLFRLHARGEYAAALKEAHRALAIAERAWGPESVDAARAINNVAELERLLGHYDDSVTLFERSLAIHEKLLGPDDMLIGLLLRNLGDALIARNDLERAEAILQRALLISEEVVGPEHPHTAQALITIGSLRQQQSRPAEAERLYRRSLAIEETLRGPDDPKVAVVLNNLALLHHDAGQYAKAEPLFMRALAINEKSLGPMHAETACVLENLAEVCRIQGRTAEGIRLVERALEIRDRSLGPDHPATANSLNSLAGFLIETGQFKLALPFLERALAIHEGSFGSDHPKTAMTLNNLAGLFDYLGEHDRARRLHERALLIHEKAVGPDHLLTAQSVSNLGVLHAEQGRFELARPLLERALANRERLLTPDHPLVTGSLQNLALFRATLGHWSEAASLYDRARRGIRRHVAGILPALPAASQLEYLHERQGRLLDAALTLAFLRRSDPAIVAISAGWLANGKAVAQEATSQQILLARQSDDVAMGGRVAALERVRAMLARASLATPDPTRAAAHRARLGELRTEEQRLVHEIGGQLAALDRDEPWVEIDAIRRNLPVGSVLVDIGRFEIFDFQSTGDTPRWQPARYAAWVIPPAGNGDVTILDLGPADEIDAAVAAYRDAIKAVEGSGFRRGQATAEEELKVAAAPLTRKVLQPIVEAIGSVTEIVLSPDGALWLVPWQAVPLADGSYAIEKFVIRTVTSARDLVPPPEYATARPGGGRGPVVVADPAFDAAPPASATQSEPSTRAFASSGRRLEPADRLPATLAEAKASAAALGKIFSREPKQLTGTAATEENVKQEAVRPPALVLATHGFFREDQVAKRDDSSRLGGTGSRGTRAVTTTGEPIEDPLLRCGLLFAGANLTNAGRTLPGDDGILTGAEIVGLDLLGTDLVVLSACQTGEGKVNVGEGVAGLRQAFQIAGARSVVATLWQVPDLESGQIMQTFYANVAKGLPPSRALREAQLTFIKARRQDRNYEAAHPFLWAAYGVTGR